MKIKNQDFIQKLAEHNDLAINHTTYNHTKLLEEMLELSEVLVKMINKKGDKAPKREKLVEELGDLQLRMDVLIYKEGLKDEVNARIDTKIASLDKYLSEGKYKGGV